MALKIPSTTREQNALEWALNPEDPLYDALYSMKENGISAKVLPNGKIRYSGGTAGQRDDLIKTVNSAKGVKGRLKSYLGHPSFSDTAKYYYQEYASPYTPWWAFENPKATNVDRFLSLAAPGLEFANPAAKGAGTMLERGAEKALGKVVPKLIKTEPIAKGVIRGGARLAPEVARLGILGGGAEATGELSGQAPGAGFGEAAEFEATRGALKAPGAVGRFLNRASTVAAQRLGNAEGPALAILHSAEFENYYKKEAQKWGTPRNWLGVLNQMSWADFSSIFGNRFQEGMETLPDEMVERAKSKLRQARDDFKRQTGIDPSSKLPVPAGGWDTGKQKIWDQTIGAAQKHLAETESNAPKVARAINRVISLNDEGKFTDEGQLRKGQKTLGEEIADTKEFIRFTLNKADPILIGEYDRVNKDYEQAKTLTKLAKEGQGKEGSWFTDRGDLDSAGFQNRLQNGAGVLRQKLGDAEFGELNNAIRSNAPAGPVDQPGVLRRGGGLGSTHISETGPRTFMKIPVPSREHPYKSHFIGDPIRQTPNLASKVGFSLLDPGLLKVPKMLQGEQQDQNAPK